MLNGENIIETIGLDNIKRIYSIEKINNNGNAIYVSVGISNKEAFKEVNKTLIINFILLVFALYVGLFAAKILTQKYIQQPINMLINTTSQISKGDLNTRTNIIHNNDEFGYLATTIDNMAKEIKSLINQEEIIKGKLSESEARLQEAQHLSQIGNWEWHIEKQTLVWSDEVFRIFGVSPGAFKPSVEAFEAANSSR